MASRTQKAKWNMTSSMVAQLLTMACGLIIPRLMIKTFGSELYGATTSITNFLAYITLIEGGIGGVARAALYKPLAEKNTVEISNVYNEIIKFFRVVGVIFIIYTLGLACSYKFLASSSDLEWFFSFILVIVISISTIGQYFLGISNSILLQADQKLYINNLLNTFTVFINTIFIVILIYLNCNIIIVKFVSSCIFLIRPFALSVYVKKKYKLLSIKECTKTNSLSQKWTALGQHIAYFLHSNTDIVVLTVLTNLKVVAVYSVYNMVVSSVRNLTASFYNGLESVLGNMYAKKEIDQLNKVFGYYETMISIVAIVLFSSTASLIVPFVRLYTQGVNDVNYVIPEFATIAVLAEMVYTLRTPYHYMVNAANRFRETRFSAYGEAVINIAFSVLLVFKFGIVGVVLATLLAMIFRSVYYAVYISKHIIHRNIWLFVKRYVINIIAFFAIFILGNYLITILGAENYFKWMICGAAVSIMAVIVTISLNFIFYKEDVWAILKRARISQKN